MSCQTELLDYDGHMPIEDETIINHREQPLDCYARLPAECSRDIRLNFKIPQSNLFLVPNKTYLRAILQVKKWDESNLVGGEILSTPNAVGLFLMNRIQLFSKGKSL